MCTVYLNRDFLNKDSLNVDITYSHLPFRRLLFLCPYSHFMKWNQDYFLSEYISIRTVCVWGGGVGGAVLFSVENRQCVKYDI